jgi:hypothetical protein
MKKIRVLTQLKNCGTILEKSIGHPAKRTGPERDRTMGVNVS